jgi:gentisate 1,2-dioxygenase
MFFQEHPQRREMIQREALSSPYRFTRADIARELNKAKAEPEGFHGARINLAAPDMPTMGLAVERLTAGANTRRYRTTANTIFHVMEGIGRTTIGNNQFSWTRGDTIAAPCWHTISHHATSDAQLFVLSDEPLLRFSNYYRFEAMD